MPTPNQEPEPVSDGCGLTLAAIVVIAWILVIQGIPILIIAMIPIVVIVALLWAFSGAIKGYDKTKDWFKGE